MAVARLQAPASSAGGLGVYGQAAPVSFPMEALAVATRCGGN